MRRSTFSLKYFIAIVLVLGCFLGLTVSNFINAPIRIDDTVLGPIVGRLTSGDAEEEPLTLDEISYALRRHERNDSALDEIQKLESVEVTLAKNAVEPERNVPTLGKAELHRAIYFCDTVCQMKNGSKKRILFKIEKNHFHLTGR